MEEENDTDQLLRSAALQTASSILLLRQRAEQELIRAKQSLELKTEELAKSLSMMQATLDSTTDGILATDARGRVTTFNEKFVEMWQVPSTAIDSQDERQLLGVLLPNLSDPSRYLARLEEINATSPEETCDLVEFADGRVFERYSKLQTIDNRGVGRVWSFRDVTERLRRERALEEEYSITEQLHGVATAIATELDLERVVQTIIDAGTKITRARFGAFFYDMIDAQGEVRTCCSVSGLPADRFAHFANPRTTSLFGPTFRGERMIRVADLRTDPRFEKRAANSLGDQVPPVISFLALPVISRSGVVLGGLFFGHDEPEFFTERDERIILGIASQAAAAVDNAQLYQAEQRARADAEHANLAKDHFLAALSHELRTPLTPVLALLHGLKENSELPPTVAEDIETIRRNVALEARLIDDLLDLTRITRGKTELHCEPVRIGQLIEDAIQTCLADITQKNLQLVRQIERPQQIIRADAARLTQILWNLLKNAVKFTPRGGNITVTSRVVNEENRARVIIEISDTGLGIEQEQLEVIFDAFEQGDRKITRQFGGLGLGLAISKAIADLHEATLTATSRGLHYGATFTLSLPFTLSDSIGGTEPQRLPADPHQQTNVAESEPRARRTARILLVEDHVDTAEALERSLRRMGHEVVSANSIASALRVAEEEPNRGKLDLLISDLGLPDGSGLTLMKDLSSAYGLPGIALSGYGMEQDLSESLAAGFSRHLTKPVNIGEVQAAIDSLVAAASKTREGS